MPPSPGTQTARAVGIGCIKCGNRAPDVATFCPRCGYRLNDLDGAGSVLRVFVLVLYGLMVLVLAQLAVYFFV